MIAALDTVGDLYLSLLQNNTNQYSFNEYMVQLVDQLDMDRPGWREDTVIQLDGARWHKTESTKELFKKLNIPVMISAPYSYSGAVCEHFFSMFKNGEINFHELGTTKSK